MTVRNLFDLDRRAVLRAGAAAAAAPVLQGVGTVLGLQAVRAQTALPELQSLRSTAKSWIWAAEDFAIGRGHFEKAGLKVAMASTLRGVNQDALLSGATDVLLSSIPTSLRVQVRGQPIRMICGFTNKYASSVVVKKELMERAGVAETSPPARKALALKGARLGTTGPGGAPDELLRFLMIGAGLSPERDAQLVSVTGGGQGMLAAVERAQIDGFCLSSPTSDLAVQKFGCAFLFNMTVSPPPFFEDYLYIVASTTEKVMAEKGPLLTAYCRGLALALKAMAANPADVREWAKQWFEGLPDELFEPVFQSNHRIFTADPVPTRPHYERNVEFYNTVAASRGQDPIPPSFGFDKAFELRFVTEAMRSV